MELVVFGKGAAAVFHHGNSSDVIPVAPVICRFACRANPGAYSHESAALAGDGAIENAGTVDIDSDNAVVTVSDNSGSFNLNGDDSAVIVTDNSGSITASGDNAFVGAGTNNGEIAAVGDESSVWVEANNGEIAVVGDDASVWTETNNGTVSVSGDDADVTVADNHGSITVSGDNAALAGNNASGGSVTVAEGGSAATTMTDEAGSKWNIDSGAELTLNDNGTGAYNGDFNNNGNLAVNTPSVFNGSVNGSDDSTITVTANGAGTDISKLMGNGTLQLDDEVDLTDTAITGNVQVNYELDDDKLAGTTITEGATLGINADSTLNAALANNGTVQVGENATLTYTDSVEEVGGAYDVQGEVYGEDTLVFTGAVNNDGTVSSANGTTFTGATSGSGDVNGKAVYDGDAQSVFGGDYTDLTVNTQATLAEGVQAEVEDLNLNGTLGTGADSTLTINGATNGNGTMTGGEGEVVYNGNSAEQKIYAGQYNDLTIGGDAVGQFDTKGDVSIGGDAVNESANAGIAVTDATVTYNGNSEQQVMAGNYDTLVMTGTGTKLMEADVISASSFIAEGTPGSMVSLASATAGEQWTLNADSASIHYANVRDANSTSRIFLDGTNVTGGNISDNWRVFNSAGGIGDSYPGEGNRNFTALAYYSDRLAIAPTEDLFAFAHRLPGGRQPIAVGESLRPELLIGSYNSYDLINFGNGDGIRLLDEESREVLSDASAAGSSDLVDLLEEK